MNAELQTPVITEQKRQPDANSPTLHMIGAPRLRIVTSFGPGRIKRQQYCLATWKKYGFPIVAVQSPGEIDALRPSFPGVEFVADERTGEAFGRPNVRIRALVEQATDAPILLVNSDISIKNDLKKFRRDFVNVDNNTFKVGVRWNREPNGKKELHASGVDVFRVTPEQVEKLPDHGFAIGCPFWDYWIIWQLFLSGYKIDAKLDLGLIHQEHPCAWTKEQFEVGWRLFHAHHSVHRNHLSQTIRALTNRHGVKTKPRVILTEEQRKHQQNKLVIVGTPRTGSNLLLYSLGEHPAAINAGEIYCRHNPAPIKKHVAACADFVAESNLFKLFVMYEKKKEFQKLLGAGKLVYLYRRDKTAQIASWKRAAETGVWSAEQNLFTDRLIKTRCPADVMDIINRAEELFMPIADLVLCYEDMIENWDETIRKVLNLVDWPDMPLKQRFQRQAP